MNFQLILQELATLKTKAAKQKRIDLIKSNFKNFEIWRRTLPYTDEQKIKSDYPYLFV
jgi:hypothetical protein